MADKDPMHGKWDMDGYVFKTGPCPLCKHKHPGSPTCGAFPKRIPSEILRGDNDHSKPYEGDNGIQFEPLVEDDAKDDSD